MSPRGVSEGDRALWETYARSVTRLSGRAAPGRPDEPPAPLSPPNRPRVADQASKPRMVASPLTVGTAPGGLDGATWQRFRSGKLPTGRKLDLHGMTTQRAFHALLGFLRAAHADQIRCVEVVTGRGSGETGGAIRREFSHWLNRPDIRPLVLGAVHPHVLNPGSVRLILRRIR